MIDDKARITKGSKVEFSIFLVDSDKRPLSLSQWASGNLIFCNCKGVKSTIALTIPGANPDKGEIAVVIPSTESIKADEKWQSADVELIDGSSETTIVVLENKFEIVDRVCP